MAVQKDSVPSPTSGPLGNNLSDAMAIADHSFSSECDEGVAWRVFTNPKAHYTTSPFSFTASLFHFSS